MLDALTDVALSFEFSVPGYDTLGQLTCRAYMQPTIAHAFMNAIRDGTMKSAVIKMKTEHMTKVI